MPIELTEKDGQKYIQADDKDGVEQATQELTELFREFEKENQKFFWDIEIVGTYPCYLELDWSIEDFEQDAYYVANIGILQDKIERDIDVDDFANSKAVETAQTILDNAVKDGLSNGSVGEWEGEVSQNELKPEMSVTVIYNPDNLR